MTDETPPTTDPGTIVVSGTGRVAVNPDVAELRLGVAISRPSVQAARAAAAEAMTAMLEAVKAAGVAPRDVRTSLLSVQPHYDYRDGKAPTLLSAGATSLDGLSFRVADPRDAERAARAAAVEEARSRADVLAEAAGVSIVGVAGIIEGEPLPAWPQPKAARVLQAADAGTPFEAGTTEIAVTVTVTYRIA